MAVRRAPLREARSSVGRLRRLSRPAAQSAWEKARVRRVAAAFLCGALLTVSGVAAFAGAGASAHGPFSSGTGFQLWGAQTAPLKPEPAAVPAYRAEAPDGRRQVAHARLDGSDSESDARRFGRDRIRFAAPARRGLQSASLQSAPLSGAHDPVCVRLCDGYFFPMTSAASDAASQNSACNSLCPDAPTEVYYRNGSDKIEDAVSAKGQRYAALPVSLRYRNDSDATCTCHRDPVAYAPLQDATLRYGDAVMTPAGFVVFRGIPRVSHSASEFQALVPGPVPAAAFQQMKAMEQASLAKDHPALREWFVSQRASPTSVAAAVVAPAPEKQARADDGKIRWLTARNGDM